MKTLTFLLLFVPYILSAQASFTPHVGGSFSPRMNAFVGAELQGSNVSITADWRPFKDNNNVYTDGFALGAAFYLWAYRSSPMFSTKIITHGQHNIDDVTGKPLRSMVIMAGYRFYPENSNRNIMEELSFDLSGGIEIGKFHTVPCIELSMNFTLFKYK